MNAFTRHEITAITPKRRIESWCRASDGGSLTRYQPILDAATGLIAAYRSVARKTSAHSLSERVELHIENSPPDKPLLLTLDHHQFMDEEHATDNAVLQVLQQHLWADVELIVCLRHAADEALLCMETYKRLQKAGIPTMVDAHAPWDLPSINTLVDANTLKFDASQLPASLEQLLGMAREMGIRTLLTEVKSRTQAAWAARKGFDWLLGPVQQARIF